MCECDGVCAGARQTSICLCHTHAPLTGVALSAVSRMQIRFAWKSICCCSEASRRLLLLSTSHIPPHTSHITHIHLPPTSHLTHTSHLPPTSHLKHTHTYLTHTSHLPHTHLIPTSHTHTAEGLDAAPTHTHTHARPDRHSALWTRQCGPRSVDSPLNKSSLNLHGFPSGGGNIAMLSSTDDDQHSLNMQTSLPTHRRKRAQIPGTRKVNGILRPPSRVRVKWSRSTHGSEPQRWRPVQKQRQK